MEKPAADVNVAIKDRPIPPTMPLAASENLPWYRKSGWVTAMVAGILLIGPIMALPVLIIVISGPVYAGSRTDERRKWEASTKGAVIFFAVLVAAGWVYKIYDALRQ